ncbi:CDP-alcohol phosphatidyltransferase family protein [Anaeromyxobacter paludicola]|uniref:CDP-alcohol phosphatidyltransferase n=1 Tax=Anaeromyxobacter paludicola TaxID=2918171 RepID=A0ABM7XFX8_9BACT|nr:CDP-alcohol phosphatidyltransferase family protein [Anaeromyxobacter paludicola]BDG10803.1 CDP-alcohol phosphatidyltransferase [Anaeromyxobacter paludicola]
MTGSSLGSLAPLLAIAVALFGTLLVFAARCALLGRPHTPAVESRGPSPFGKWLQEWWIWLFDPLVRLCVRAGVGPDAITASSAVVVAVAAVLLATGDLPTGGWIYLFGASLDLVDGRVARATGRATRAGAFLDSTLDRVAELLAFGGLAVHFRGSQILYAALAAAFASVLVSYARARGESLGAGEAARVGGMQRPERIAFTGLACVLSPLAEAWAGPGGARTFVGAALTAVAVLSAGTALRRAVSIHGALSALERTDRGGSRAPTLRLVERRDARYGP